MPHKQKTICRTGRFSGNGNDMLELKDWDSFCVIVGSAAGALIGLQFVVMTLIAGRPERPSADAGAAFATPTIVYFCAVLFLAAVFRAPWQTVLPAAILWGIAGLVGIVYTLIIVRRMRTQTVYESVLEDWLCYALLPLGAYTLLTVSAFAALARTREALFGVGASMLALLFIGIRNAWDGVAYHVFTDKQKTEGSDGQSGKDETDDSQQ
jgi:hypothetical protein